MFLLIRKSVALLSESGRVCLPRSDKSPTMTPHKSCKYPCPKLPQYGDLRQTSPGSHRRYGAPYTVEECKARDATYAAPIKVKVRLHNKETGEIKEQELFMGDFPVGTGPHRTDQTRNGDLPILIDPNPEHITEVRFILQPSTPASRQSGAELHRLFYG